MNNWPARPLRALASVDLGRQRAPQHDQGPHMIPYLRAANVSDGQLNLYDIKEMNFSPGEQRIFALRAGDVLVTEGSGSIRTVGASAVWRSELPGTLCFQNTLLRLRSRSRVTDPRFLEWWCRSAFGDGVFASIATGANIYHLSAERLRGLPIRCPPPDAQRAIADFLDAETARINALITKKRRLIGLIQEQTQSRIFAAVRGSRGSDCEKDSGLDWLGMIPADWPVMSVGMQFEVMLGKMLNEERSNGGHLKTYLRNTNVQWDNIDTSDLLLMSFPPHERRRYEVLAGDLLVCEGGEPGRAAIWDGSVAEIYYQKALHRVRPRGHSLPRWLFYCLRAAKDLNVFAIEGNTTTISHLTGEQLSAYRFPFPDKATQERLVAYLDMAAARDGKLVQLVQRQLDSITEHRQALITAAVTGELDIPARTAG
jgi:type I restriction enzyme, S subunit